MTFLNPRGVSKVSGNVYAWAAHIQSVWKASDMQIAFCLEQSTRLLIKPQIGVEGWNKVETVSEMIVAGITLPQNAIQQLV